MGWGRRPYSPGAFGCLNDASRLPCPHDVPVVIGLETAMRIAFLAFAVASVVFPSKSYCLPAVSVTAQYVAARDEANSVHSTVRIEISVQATNRLFSAGQILRPDDIRFVHGKVSSRLDCPYSPGMAVLTYLRKHTSFRAISRLITRPLQALLE